MNDTSNATNRIILTQCDFVKNQCDPESNFNFFTLFYCTFDEKLGDKGKYFMFIPLGIFFVFIFMYLLLSTADDYLSSSLEFLTVKFKIS